MKMLGCRLFSEKEKSDEVKALLGSNENIRIFGFEMKILTL